MSTTPVTPHIYTPPNWSDQKALYSITFKSSTTSSIDQNGVLQLTVTNSANGYNPNSGLTMFVFDAIRRAGHKLRAIPTRHPLQTGFNTSDHVIVQPAALILEVSMSDAIAAYSNGPGMQMWGSNPSKSVAAFQQMEQLMIQRQLLTVNTRLKTYTNMVLIDMETEETHRTYFGGLAMILSFEQLFFNEVALQTDSARAQTTAETQLGNVTTVQPSPTTLAQHTQPSITIPKLTGITSTNILPNPADTFFIPGAGMISSNLTGQP